MSKYDVYGQENFAARGNYAAKCMMRGMVSSRHLDTCFEMNDGDAVVTALVRRTRNNPKLREAIVKQWGGTFPESWETTAKQFDHVPTRQLTAIARALRTR